MSNLHDSINPMAHRHAREGSTAYLSRYLTPFKPSKLERLADGSVFENEKKHETINESNNIGTYKIILMKVTIYTFFPLIALLLLNSTNATDTDNPREFCSNIEFTISVYAPEVDQNISYTEIFYLCVPGILGSILPKVEQPPERETRREATERRDKRVLGQLDACVRTRANYIEAVCTDPVTGQNRENCEYTETIDYIPWLSEDYGDNMQAKHPIYSVKIGKRKVRIPGRRVGDRIEIDPRWFVDFTSGNIRERDSEMAKTIIHERLHGYPWRINGRKMTAKEEEDKISNIDDLIRDEMSDAQGSWNSCGADWNVRRI